MILNRELKIFNEFIKETKQELTGSHIAKKNKLNQKTVANYLNKLEKKKILKSKTQGKNKLYSLNIENKELIEQYILSIEHLRTFEFYEKNKTIKEICKQIKPLIKGSAIIFGSYAKNKEKENSDLDIAIIGKCKKEEINKISEMYNIEISLKIYSKFKKDLLMKEIINNHIIIKNTEQIIEEILHEKNKLV